MQYTTNSEKETKKLAEKIAQWIRQAHYINVVALTGELGAGKTTFVQGFAKGLGIKDKIISPTFVLIRQHLIPKTKKILPAGRQVLFHVDLYRINSFQELGLKEILKNPDNVVLIEWAEKLNYLSPKNSKKIIIEKLEGDKRIITID